MKRFYKLLIFSLILSVFMTGCYSIPFKEYRHEYSIFNFSGEDTSYCCIRNGKYYYTSDDGVYQMDIKTRKTVRLLEGKIHLIATNDDYLYALNNNCKLTVISLNDNKAAPYSVEGSFTDIAVNGKDIFLSESTQNGCIDYIRQDDLLKGISNMKRNILKNIKNERFIGQDMKCPYSFYSMQYGEYDICTGFNKNQKNIMDIWEIYSKTNGKDNHGSFATFNNSYSYFGNRDKIIFNNLLILEKNKESKKIDLQGFSTSTYNMMKDSNNLYLLAQKGKNIPPVNYNRYEMYHEEDAIFKVDAQTDKQSIIYRLKKKDGRIIGFRNNNVYIYKSGKIRRYDLNKKTTKEIALIKEKNHMTFEMCGNYIFIIGRDKDNEDSPNLSIDEKKTIEEAVRVGN